MKKLIVALLLAITIVGFAKQTHALSLDDLLQEIKGLKQQVVELKEQLGAAVLKAGSLTTMPAPTIAPTVPVQPAASDASWYCQQHPEDIACKGATVVKTPTVQPAASDASWYCQQYPNDPKCEGATKVIQTPTVQPAASDASWYCQQHPEDIACKGATVVKPVTTAPGMVTFTHNLKYGEKGEEVTKLQKLLVAAGYLSADNATGLYGKMTVAAVKAFQKDKGINDDGTVVGPKTQAAFSFNGTITATPFPGGSMLPCSLTNTTPQIKVTSPNGGESYQPGQQITVKWATCGIPATSQMNILLEVPSMSWDIGLIQNYTSNDGSEVVTLPTATQVPNLPSGTLFKIKVIQVAPVGTLDKSDNLFTIGGAQQACSIFQPTISTSGTTISQYVATGATSGAVNATQVSYNFTAPQQTTITELKFQVDIPSSVTSVRVGSVSAPVVNGVAWLQGLNIVVPQGVGTIVNALFSYPPVGPNGISSNTQSMVGLNYAKFVCSGTGTVNTATITVGATNKMFIVGSKPTLSVNNTTSHSGLLSGAENKIGEVTITADAKGDIKINDILFYANANMSGFSTSSARIADGSATIPGSTCTGSNTITCEFGSSSNNDYDGYIIPAGTSKTFSLYAIVFGSMNGSSSVTTSLSSQYFNWDDTATNGSSGTNLTGDLIYAFPIGSYYIHQ